MTPAIEVRSLSHRYGERVALRELSADFTAGKITAILGPNGSGKSTLFRIISTLVAPRSGSVRVLGLDIVANPTEVRQQLGCTFQSPSLDRQLTVIENLKFHARLFGFDSASIRQRVTRLLEEFELSARGSERVSTLSGGLRRRVEIAKALISEPRLLILDEPSTGLDPLARAELILLLQRLRDSRQLTVLLTTHLMDEAEKCDDVVILNEGSLVARGAPADLIRGLEGDVVEIRAAELEELRRWIASELGLEAQLAGGSLRLIAPNADVLIPKLLSRQAGSIESCSLHRASLEDVFIRLTGKRLRGE